MDYLHMDPRAFWENRALALSPVSQGSKLRGSTGGGPGIGKAEDVSENGIISRKRGAKLMA